MKKVLYITYDGITDPLGYSQVFRYLENLVKEHSIYLISFEKKELKKTENYLELKKKARDCGIVWLPLTYHKTPTIPATFFDLLQGIICAAFFVLFCRINIVHVRSYVAGVMGWTIKKVFRVPLLFDMRGFWADERIEGGLWRKESRIYSIAKNFEHRFFRDADRVVSLTYKGREVIEGFDYLKERKNFIDVIPTCADLVRFHPEKQERKFGDRFIVGYSGSVGLWYDFPTTLRAFQAFKNNPKYNRPLLLVLNKGEHEKIQTHLKDFGFEKEDYILLSSPSDEMPYWLNQMDVNVYFIRASFSKQASAPTKLAEILGCGKSVITNDFVGDSGKIIRENRVGVVTNSFEEQEVVKAVEEWFTLSQDAQLAERCVETSKKYFSLDAGVKEYSRIYNSL